MMTASIRVGRCVTIMLLALAIACGPDDVDHAPGSVSGSSSASDFGRRAQWTALPAAPLVARYEADCEWVADRFVVLGGWSSSMCPPSASCLPPAEPARRDGASFDPVTGRWTRIADAPVPVSGLNTVALDGRLYLLTGIEYRADSPAAFLSYDPQQDTWTRHPLPPARGALVATDSAIVLVPWSEEGGPQTDAVFSPETDTWRRLPNDPLGLSSSRSAIWVDGSLLLAANDLVPNPGSEHPVLVRLARLDDGLSRWSMLPASEIIGYTPVAVAGQAVWPYTGSANGGGGGKGDWGRSYPEGGIFDPTTRKWLPLPVLPWDATVPCCNGAVVGDRVMVGDQLFDPVTARWSTIPPLPGTQRMAGTVVGSPHALLVWGGAIPAQPPKSALAVENVATGYLFRPASSDAEPVTVPPAATAAP